MYKKILARSISILFAMAVVLALPQSAAAQATVFDLQATVPIATTIINPCTFESLALNGTEFFKLHQVGDATGGAHVTLNLDTTGTASGAVISYAYTENDTFAFHLNPFIATADTARLSTKAMLRGAAKGDNSIMRIAFHITMNADGTLTSVVDQISTICKG